MSNAAAPSDDSYVTNDSPDINPDLYYRHSGRQGFAIPLAILIGIPVTIALAAVYAYVVVYCPVVGYVNLLFLGAFVCAGGFMLNRIAKVGKCRSEMTMTAIGLLLGCIGLYFAWVFFIKALIPEIAVVQLILRPAGFWQIICGINAEGWWGPSGLAQWALVAIEAALIVGGFTLAGLGSIGENIFCEDCGSWCKPFAKLHLKNDPALSAEERPRSNLDRLSLPETTDDDYPRYDADVLRCESCQSMQAIRFYNVTQQLDDGELKESREEIPGVLVKKG